MGREIIFIVAIFSAGCMIGGMRHTGEVLFAKEQVEKIERGVTTKQEVLQWFGPPVALARKGEDGKELRSENLRTDTFIEICAGKHTINQDHVIYYYRNEGRRSVVGVAFLALGEKSWQVRERLWILINERTGVVEDYMLREDE